MIRIASRASGRAPFDSFVIVDINRSPSAGRLGAVHPAPVSTAWPPTDRLPDHCLGKVNGNKEPIAVHFRRN